MIDRNLITATLLPFFAACIGYCLLSWYFSMSSLSAPNVIGHTLSEGCALLSQHRLNARVMAYVEDDAYPAGTIIDQKPRPGKSIKAHQAMLLTIVADKPLIKIPDIRGLKLVDAIKLVEKKGLKIFSYPMSSDLPANTCIAQWPDQDSLVESHTIMLVYYAVSKKLQYLVPSFINNRVEESLESIEKYGHNVECIHYRTHAVLTNEYARAGIVVAQKPLPGTLFDEIEKETIYLTVKI